MVTESGKLPWKKLLLSDGLLVVDWQTIGQGGDLSLAVFTLKWWVSTLTALARPWRPRRKAAHSLPGT